MLNPDAIHIWRDADGDYHLEWQTEAADTAVVVEALAAATASVDVLDRSSYGARARITGLPHARTHQFRLQDQFGNEVIATERKLGMQGTPNFRDYGGYRTTTGQSVKWGYLYRSGQLSSLTGQDLALLESLGLDLLCDFRREEEQLNAPNRLPLDNAPRTLSLPITPGSNADFFEQAGSGFGGRQAMYDFMLEINRDFALAQTDVYSRMFAEVLAVDDAKFLVHCAAGKDRTGFAAALVLLALGVPEDVVLKDYLMSARYFKPELELERIQEKYQMDLPAEAIMPMLEVHEEYLDAALEEISRRYGSIEAYLAQELGVGAAELAELRRRYLG
jgi:protein-tyrosine phosphatase